MTVQDAPSKVGEIDGAILTANSFRSFASLLLLGRATLPQATLSIVKSDTDGGSSSTIGTASPGTDITYTVRVSNAGPSNATNVSVSDLLPSGETYVSSNAPAGTTYNSTTGIWTVGLLAAGASATLTITAAISSSATGTISNTATATATDASSVSATDTDTVSA